MIFNWLYLVPTPLLALLATGGTPPPPANAWAAQDGTLITAQDGTQIVFQP